MSEPTDRAFSRPSVPSGQVETAFDNSSWRQQEGINGLTTLEYAAIHLRVEHPDISPWLNEVIRKSRRDELAKAAMQGILTRKGTGWGNLVVEDATKEADALLAMLKENEK